MPGVLTPHLLANNSRYAQTTNLHEVITPTRYGGCPHSFNSTCPAKSHEFFIWKWGWKSFFADLIGKIHYWNKDNIKGAHPKIRLHTVAACLQRYRRGVLQLLQVAHLLTSILLRRTRQMCLSHGLLCSVVIVLGPWRHNSERDDLPVFVSQEGLWFEQLSVVNFKFGEAKRGQSHLTVTINEEV